MLLSSKPAILYTSLSMASRNIAEHLLSLIKDSGLDIRTKDFRVKSVLEIPPDFPEDWAIVLSPHRSKNPKPMLTAHFPGNWGKADYGGRERQLTWSYPSALGTIILKLKEYSERSGLNWPVYIEADHHGPFTKKPMIFVEIGSTEKEWQNPLAGEVIAKSVFSLLTEGLMEFTAFFGLGGGHYSSFTSLVEKALAPSHICPKYHIDNVSEEQLLQGLERSVEKVERLIILKDETNRRQKEKILSFSQKYSLPLSFV